MLVRLIRVFTARQCTLLTPETTCLKQPVFTWNRPSICRSLITGAASIPKAKLLATHYQQTNLDWYNSRNTTKLDESVNRVMPQFKVDGKMVFERDMEMLAPGYTQTLEPRAQYLYVPYRDQSDIYNYDSSLLQSDYSGLFRDRTYGGLDRIASANQVTTGVTSRIYDDAAVERFNISVGQLLFHGVSHWR